MATQTNWVIDTSHAEIGFRVRHLMISNIKGEFKDFRAEIVTDGNDFSTAKVEMTIQANSIDTLVADRNTHLKSADFFDVEQYKELKFVSEKVEKVDDENFLLYGDLTIKDKTNKVKLNVEFGGLIKDPWGNEKAGFTVTGKINRKDWGLIWNASLEAGGVLVGDEIKINCEFELGKA